LIPNRTVDVKWWDKEKKFIKLENMEALFLWAKGFPWRPEP
jgi:hypothetical protein